MSNQIVQYPGPGCVVEFMHGDRPQQAWVLEEQGGKLRLLTANAREMKLTTARIMPWAGPQYDPQRSRQDILGTLAEHQARREELQREIDSMEIWDLAQGEVSRAPLTWFAELLWEDPDADQLAALGRALLECKTHFKFNPPDFEIHPEEKVEARLKEQETARRREMITGAAAEFFKELWAVHLRKKERVDTEPEGEQAEMFRDLLLRLMADDEDRELETIWRAAKKGMPDDPHLPFLLARAWGIVDEHHNFLLDRAGYQAGDAWTVEFARAMDEQRAAFAGLQSKITEFPAPLVSVDSETTRDVDDAFCFVREEGGYRVIVALALPSLAWEFGSDLDRAVANRATSLYLPEGDSHMLPEALGTDLFSLHAEKPKPALILDMRLDEAAKPLSCEPGLAWVRIRANLAYSGVEAALAGNGQELEDQAYADAAVLESLRIGTELSVKLRDNRIADGAVIIERPDSDIVLHREEGRTRVELGLKPEFPNSQLLVSEMMILANTAAAEWAGERNLPLYHRTQAVNLPKEAAGIWKRPEDIHRVVKVLGSSTMEVNPRPHACLGVQAYCPLTSPLRRYTDLVNAAQIAHQIRHGKPLFSAEDLELKLPGLNARLEAAGRVQRFRPRYWKLLYFKQQPPDARYHAVVIEENRHFVMASLPKEQLFVRAPRDKFSDKLTPGDVYQLRLGKIDPLANEITVLEAWEE